MRYYRSFVLWDKRKLNRSLIRPDSVMLSRTVLEKVLENRTDFDLEELLLKRLPTALTLKEGNVLSVASVNEHGKTSGFWKPRSIPCPTLADRASANPMWPSSAILSWRNAWVWSIAVPATTSRL